ncbi:MAG: cohesin domain-containing protein [Clostridia bacterium]|nr:cohesin domain-containing protein [Clostridia bacterium]
MIPAQAAFAESTPILLLSGKAEGEEIVVTATLRNNEAVSAMVLQLEYDRDKLVLIGCEEGEALSSLDFIASGNYDVYPFLLNWSGDENDSSNGKLVTLRFSVKDAASGKAFVKLTYTRDRDINYNQFISYLARNCGNVWIIPDNSLSKPLRLGCCMEIYQGMDSRRSRYQSTPENRHSLVVKLSINRKIAVIPGDALEEEFDINESEIFYISIPHHGWLSR